MDDAILMKLIQGGDDSAYRRLFLKYYSPLCEYASCFVGMDESEDLVQRLMIYIWEERKNLCFESSLKSYLFRATKNRCLNSIRNRKVHSRIRGEIYEEQINYFEEADYVNRMKELLDRIDEEISLLPENYRETFELSRFGDVPNRELSLMLSVSEKTIEYRITQSLKILRKKLRDFLPMLYIMFSIMSK